MKLYEMINKPNINWEDCKKYISKNYNYSICQLYADDTDLYIKLYGYRIGAVYWVIRDYKKTKASDILMQQIINKQYFGRHFEDALKEFYKSKEPEQLSMF